jgi:hypothetical protein
MSLKAKYRPIKVYKKITPEDRHQQPYWEDVTGEKDVAFIQPSSGKFQVKRNKGGEDITHFAFQPMDVSNTLETGDKVEQDDQTYIVEYATQPTGISGRNNHKEVDLRVFK